MAFYYVDANGTAAGDAGRETVKRTGVFEANANNYVSILAALGATTPPAAGDSFLCANDSAGTPYAANTTLSGPTGDTAPLEIISVDEQNQENALAGFKEGFSTASDLLWQGSWVGWGYSPDPIGDEIRFTASNSNLLIQNGTINLTSDGALLQLNNDGCTLRLIDYILNFAITTNSLTGISLGAGCTVEMFGGSITSTTTGSMQFLIGGLGTGGGFAATFKGVDLSIVTTALLGNVGAATGDDRISMIVEGCQLNGSLTNFVEEAFVSPNQEITVTHSSSSSTASEHQFFHRNYRGDVEDNIARTRVLSVAFPDSDQKISLLVSPDTLCTRLSPFVFEIPVAFVNLSGASTDTLQFFITSDTSLTDADIWAEVHYADGTNKNVYNAASGALQLSGSYTIDPLGTGTTLTTDASWTNPLTFQQTFKVTTSGDPGINSAPIVRIYVATTAILHIDPVFIAVAT